MSALSDRDTNVQMATSKSKDNNTDAGDKKQSMMSSNPLGEENNKRSLEQRIADQNNKQSSTYISPSDAILSPASQKLAGFKQRQINKQNARNPTARSLFARTASGVSAASLEDSDDIPPASK